MKRIALFSALAIALSVSSQEKVKPVDQSIKLDYNRNSLSVVQVQHKDEYDKKIQDAYLKLEWNEKFDDNIIDRFISVTYPRLASNTIEERAQSIGKELRTDDLGKQVVSFWFARKEESGMMSPELFQQRGIYNATDQDFKHFNAVKVKDALKDKGANLIPNSYILVLDYTKLNRTVEQVEDLFTKKKKEVAYWNTTVEAYLFRVNFTKTTQDYIYDKCWIDSEDSPEVIANKKLAYDTLSIGLAPVTSVIINVKHDETKGGFDGAIERGLNEVIAKFEKKVDKWQVKVALQKTKPISAKVGKKEGLKNKSRFFVYATVEDDKDNVSSEKRGVVRATTIADNATVASGDSPMSDFYQISGRTLEPGMVMQQKPDLGMGVTAGWRIGGNSGFMMQIDQLISIKTNGVSQYAMIDFSTDAYNVKDNKLNNKIENISAINLGIGYGYGFRLGRPVELVPNIIFGAEYLNSLEDLTDEKSSFTDNLGYYGTLGVKVNFNIAYPLQLTGGVDYTLPLGGSEDYESYKEIMDKANKKRGGFGFFVGLKYTL